MIDVSNPLRLATNS